MQEAWATVQSGGVKILRHLGLQLPARAFAGIGYSKIHSLCFNTGHVHIQYSSE